MYVSAAQVSSFSIGAGTSVLSNSVTLSRVQVVPTENIAVSLPTVSFSGATAGAVNDTLHGSLPVVIGKFIQVSCLKWL